MKFPKNIKNWKFAKNCQKCPFWILEKFWKNFNFFNKFFWIFWPLKRYVVLQWKLQKRRVIFSNMRTAHYMSKWHVIFHKTTCRFILTTTTSWCRKRYVIFFSRKDKNDMSFTVVFFIILNGFLTRFSYPLTRWMTRFNNGHSNTKFNGSKS